VREAAIARDGLERVAEGVAQVEQAPRAGFALVARDDPGLHPHRGCDRVLEQLRTPGRDVRGRLREPREERAIRQHRALQDLVGAAAELPLWQRREQLGVGDHGARLVERAHQVLGAGVVDADLASDRAVHHREQRGRDLHPVEPAHVDGGGEAREVADDAPAERQHDAVATEAAPLECRAELHERRHGLASLAVRDDDRRPGRAPAQRGREARALRGPDARARDHQQPPALERAEQRRQRAERAVADRDRVRRRAGPDRDLDHARAG
jgi:hypothetical protein